MILHWSWICTFDVWMCDGRRCAPGNEACHKNWMPLNWLTYNYQPSSVQINTREWCVWSVVQNHASLLILSWWPEDDGWCDCRFHEVVAKRILFSGQPTHFSTTADLPFYNGRSSPFEAQARRPLMKARHHERFYALIWCVVWSCVRDVLLRILPQLLTFCTGKNYAGIGTNIGRKRPLFPLTKIAIRH